MASSAKATAQASTQTGASIRIDIIRAAAIMARRNITRPSQVSGPSWRKTTLHAARAIPVAISVEFGLTAPPRYMVIGVTAITTPVTATDLRTRVIAALNAQAMNSAASADAASRSAQMA